MFRQFLEYMNLDISRIVLLWLYINQSKSICNFKVGSASWSIPYTCITYMLVWSTFSYMYYIYNMPQMFLGKCSRVPSRQTQGVMKYYTHTGLPKCYLQIWIHKQPVFRCLDSITPSGSVASSKGHPVTRGHQRSKFP